MEQFSLDEYLKNPSRKVVTREGIPVKIHCTNYNLGHRCIIAEVEGNDFSYSFTRDGKYCNSGDSPFDIFFAPEKHERWVNLYKRGQEDYFLGAEIYIDKEHAEVVAGRNRVATIKIEWEE